MSAPSPQKLRSVDLKDFRGRRIRMPSFDLITRSGENTSRYAIIVTKKTASKAVDRNHIKRRLRPIVSTALQSLPSPIDVLLIVKQPLESLSPRELKEAVYSTIKGLL